MKRSYESDDLSMVSQFELLMAGTGGLGVILTQLPPDQQEASKRVVTAGLEMVVFVQGWLISARKARPSV